MGGWMTAARSLNWATSFSSSVVPNIYQLCLHRVQFLSIIFKFSCYLFPYTTLLLLV